MSLGVPAEPPHLYLVLAVGRGGVSVQDPVALGQAQPARVTDVSFSSHCMLLRKMNAAQLIA